MRMASACPERDQIVAIRVVSTAVTLTLEQDGVDASCLAALAALSAATPIGYINMHLQPAGSDKGVHPWTTFGTLLHHLALDPETTDATCHVGVSLMGGDQRRFIAVCSAVRESQCVGSFAVFTASTSWPRHEWLRWLAWSWLGSGNNHADLSVEFHLEDLREEDVKVCRAVLVGGNPWSSSGCPVQWLITTSRIVVNCVDVDSDATTELPEGTRLAVVDDASSDGQWYVLVPGFGMARIDQATVHASTSVLSVAASHRRSRVTTLELFVTADSASVAGVLALVQLLGSGLRSLRIVSDKQTLEREHVIGIVQACPRLVRLNLSTSTLADLDFLVDVCNEPTSNLTELILHDVHLTQSTGANGLVAALTSPTSRMARQLQVMALGFTKDASVDAAAVEALYDMLDTNRWLKTVQVRFPAYLRPSTMKYPARDGASIARPACMARLDQKLALLSALRSADSAPLTARHTVSLDRLALTNVFAFAAEQTVRLVTRTTSSCEHGGFAC